MTHAHGRQPATTVPLLALALTLALAAAACDATGPSLAPVTTASGVPAVSVAPAASPPASPIPSPASTPIASPSMTTACVVTPQTGRLPSDRFTDLKVAAGATADTLTFVFGPASLGTQAGAATGSLDVARPPYTRAGSGATIDVVGGRVVRVRFSGMSLQNDAGEEIYKGPPEFKPGFAALRDAVLYDASEGVVGWYVGYDGPGCVTLVRNGNNVTVAIDHP